MHLFNWGAIPPGRVSAHVFRALCFSLCVSASVVQRAEAQTTVVLNVPGSQVIDTTIRNGPYANANQDGAVLLTRSSTVPEWERRTILGFNTSSIPDRTVITSATLTLTLKSGLGTAGAKRPVDVRRLASAFTETQATWNSRQTGVAWQTPGGDLSERTSSGTVTNVAGAKITFDLTALAQRAINGEFERQVRIALIDTGGGGDAKESYREYHSSEASSSASRPQLTIRYGTTSPGTTIDVPAGGDLQAALNQVQPGGTIRLAAGATYTGNFKLPAKGGTSFIVITTNTALPPAGTRIDPSYRTRLATIKSPNGASALATAAGASYYRIVGVSFDANVDGAGEVIALGRDAQTTLAEVPHHIELDRVLITGDAAVGQRRGIAVNAAHVTIANSDIRDIKDAGQDSQAIAGWNTPGPITIRNNYLEAAGENIMFGGAHINIPNVVPSDILVEDNFLTKDPLWRGMSWTVKNLFELKNARRVLVRRNIMEYNWSGGQAGFAIVLTPRNSSGRTPWVVIEDVEFSSNIIRSSSSVFNILGYDDNGTERPARPSPHPQQPRLRHPRRQLGRHGHVRPDRRRAAQHHDRPQHGAAHRQHRALSTARRQYRLRVHEQHGEAQRLRHLRQRAELRHGSLAHYAPGYVVRRNVLASDKAVASRYPPDNFFPTVANFTAGFVDPATRDYRLVSSSPYVGAGTDGQDIGCVFAQ